MTFRQWLMIALIAVLSVMALFKFIRQDLSSASIGKADDFAFIYVAGNAWMEGKQPYTFASLDAEAIKLYGIEESAPLLGMVVVYPPSTFLPMLPILLLPHQAVIGAVLLFSIATYLGIAWILARDLSGLSRWAFLAFAVNYAPLHSGLRPRNVTVLLAAMILLPLLTAARNRMLSPWWFVFLGLGVGIKPQLGALFLLILVVMGEWKRFFVALSTAGASVLISAGWLAVHGVHWVAPLLANLRQGPSGANQQSTLSFVYNGAANFRLINFSPVVYLFSGNYKLSSLLPVGLAIALFVYLAMLVRDKGVDRLGLVWVPVIGVIGAISLIPAYSRFYGAVLILPVFAWLWSQWERPVLRGFLLAGAVLFSLPMPQFPILWQAAADYFAHPEMGLAEAARSVTLENFTSFSPAYWQELVGALPNLFLPAVSILLLSMMARRVPLFAPSEAARIETGALRG